MTIAENKAVVLRIEAAINAHDVEAVAALIGRTRRIMVARSGARASGRRSSISSPPSPTGTTRSKRSSPRWVAVVVRSLTTATHLGTPAIVPIHSMMGIAPTGRPVVLRSIHIWQIRDGLAIGHRAVRDDLETMKQIGLWPTA